MTRPRGCSQAGAAVGAAALAGVATGLAPYPTLVVAGAVLSIAVLLPRVDLAALAVIATAVVSDGLDRLVPGATQWLMVLLLLAWLVRRAAGPLHPGRTGPLLVPAGVFAVVLLLAAVAHPQGAAGVAVSLRYVLLLAVFAVLVDVLAGPLAPRRAVRAYVLSCALAAAGGLVAVLAGVQHRASGPLASPDDLGFFLVAAVPLSATFPRRVALPVALLLVAGVLATDSRGAWIALGVVLVVAVLTRTLSLRWAGLGLALVGTAAALVLAVRPHTVGSTLAEQQRYAETRLSQRAELWAAAAAITREHPALGLGPGAFRLYHHDVRDPDAASDLVGRDLDVAHSTVLQASAELGVLGAATLLGVFLTPLVAARRRWRRDRLVAAAGLALTGLVIASLLETEQQRLPLWLLAALTAVLARPEQTLGLRDLAEP